MLELSESFKNRVYYAARDGLAITLYALLSEKSLEEAEEVLNQVLIVLTCVIYAVFLCLADTRQNMMVNAIGL